MLEQNPLYRRIQRSNLFKTFTRPYNRNGRGSISTQTKRFGRTTDSNYPGSTPFLRTLEPDQNSTSKTVNVQLMSHRLQRNLEATLNERSKTTLNETNQFSRHAATEMNSAQSYRERKYVVSQGGSLLSNPSIGGSGSKLSLTSWNQRKAEKFKLRACLERKPVHYETEWDETDFSLLEVKRRNMMEKYQHNAVRKQIKEKQTDQNYISIAPTIGKKGSSQLTKYSKLMQENYREKRS